jgi:hypothetical protein
MRPALDPAGHRVPRTKPTCLLHTWRPHRRRPFALVLHQHQHQSSRNLHLQYLAKNQSAQHCQSLITQGSNHPLILEPHMVLTRQPRMAALCDVGAATHGSAFWHAGRASPSSQRYFTTFKLEISKWNSIFSKKESCRLKYRLQHSQRSTWCLSKGSAKNTCESWYVTECRDIVSNWIDQDFEQFPLKV